MCFDRLNTLNKVLINGKYIIGASTERHWNNKVFDYDGNLITDKLPIATENPSDALETF